MGILGKWKTRIAEASSRRILVRGYDIQELMENLTFAEAVYLVINGDLPTKNQGRMMDALLISACDHGISPSAVLSRYVAAAGVPFQVSLAAGLLPFGDLQGGAMEELSRILQEAIGKKQSKNMEIDQLAKEIVASYVDNRKRLPGFGHPEHPRGDPRVPKLFELARKFEVLGDHIRLIQRLDRALAEKKGRRFPPNIDGGIAGVISDLGFDWRTSRAFILISRSAGLAAHIFEEITGKQTWRIMPPSEYEIAYDEPYYEGPPERRLTR